MDPFLLLSTAMFFFGSSFFALFFCHFAYTTPSVVVLALPVRYTVLPRSRVISTPALLVVIVCVPTLSAPALLLSVFLLSVCLSVCTHRFISTNPSCYRVLLPSYSVCESIIVYSYITMRSRNVNVVKKKKAFKGKRLLLQRRN